MPSKELIASVAAAIKSKVPVGYGMTEAEAQLYAQAAISAIRAALKEPSEHMLAEAMYLDRPIYVWRAMLAASALGEQSE